VLTDGEICAFWEGLERTTIGMPIRYALKLQLVTAQRKGEIVAAEWPEFDLHAGWWTIPADRSKNHLAHRVPLSLVARQLLHDMPRLDDRFLCPSPTGSKPTGDTSVDHAVRRNLGAFGVGRFTPPLRVLFAAHPHLLSPVLQIVHRVIATFLIQQAGLQRTEAHTGSVTLIQRFGSAANLNIHLHCLVLDGSTAPPRACWCSMPCTPRPRQSCRHYATGSSSAS
jgi:integrase-like protein/putative transposase